MGQACLQHISLLRQREALQDLSDKEEMGWRLLDGSKRINRLCDNEMLLEVPEYSVKKYREGTSPNNFGAIVRFQYHDGKMYDITARGDTAEIAKRIAVKETVMFCKRGR